MSLPTDKQSRKERPIARGVIDYFPDALAEIAHVSFKANEQHNPGEEMHWDREKSTDHADCLVRHLIDRGKLDSDGLRHTAKAAWRALALLQEEVEKLPRPVCRFAWTVLNETDPAYCFHESRADGSVVRIYLNRPDEPSVLTVTECRDMVGTGEMREIT